MKELLWPGKIIKDKIKNYELQIVSCSDNIIVAKVICSGELKKIIDKSRTYLFYKIDDGGCKKYTTEEFIQKAKEIHGNKYDYSKVNYINAYTNIIIICSTHGEFLQTPDHHINQKSGCKLCSNRISIGSQEYLDYNNIPIEYREKYINIPNFHKVFLDSFDPIKNEGREYDGDWWHGNPKIYNQNDIHPIAKITYGELYKRTLEKHAAIRSIGIKLVTIWESDWKKSSERKEYLKIKEK